VLPLEERQKTDSLVAMAAKAMDALEQTTPSLEQTTEFLAYQGLLRRYRYHFRQRHHPLLLSLG